MSRSRVLILAVANSVNEFGQPPMSSLPYIRKIVVRAISSREVALAHVRANERAPRGASVVEVKKTGCEVIRLRRKAFVHGEKKTGKP